MKKEATRYDKAKESVQALLRFSDLVFFEKVNGFGGTKCTYLALSNAELFVLTLQEFNYANVPSQCSELQRHAIANLCDLKLETSHNRSALVANGSVLTFAEPAHNEKLVYVVDAVKALRHNQPAPPFADKRQFCQHCGTKTMKQTNHICLFCSPNQGGLLRMLSMAKEFKWQTGVAFVIAMLNSAISIFVPFVGVRYFVDEVLTLGGSRFGEVLQVGLFIVGVKLMQVLIRNLFLLISSHIIPTMILGVKQKLFVAVQKQPMKFFSEHAAGKIMNQISSDSEIVYWFLLEGIVYNASNLLNVLGVSVVLLLISPPLALLVFAFVPLIVLVARFFVKLQARNASTSYIASSRVAAKLTNVLGGQRVIKANGKEDEEIGHYERLTASARRISIKAGSAHYYNYTFITFITDILPVLAWGYGFYLVTNGALTISTVLLVVSYMGLLIEPILFMASESEWFGQAITAANRVFSILDAVPDLVEDANPITLTNPRGELTLSNVTFEYDAGKPVLSNVSLDIAAGEMIGVVGKSGAGKSTLANLISRLYDVTKGAIYIDGINLKQLSFDTLHKTVGMVSQDIFIFEGTILENIRYARPEASLEEVVKAAKMADAHEFIVKMDNGYETFIGGNAKSLSGGQRQRLSIARTLIQNPKILILDEATSAMDTKTEQNIQASIEQLGKHCTTFIIAHRLSTLRHANRIIVLEKGELKQVGSHSELLCDKDGIYAKLIQIQNDAMKLL